MSFSRFNSLPARTETTMLMICMPEFHPAEPEQIGRQETLNPQILRRSSTQLSNTTGTMKPSMKIWERSIMTLLWGEKQNRFQTHLLIWFWNLFLCYITYMIWFSYWAPLDGLLQYFWWIYKCSFTLYLWLCWSTDAALWRIIWWFTARSNDPGAVKWSENEAVNGHFVAAFTQMFLIVI